MHKIASILFCCYVDKSWFGAKIYSESNLHINWLQKKVAKICITYISREILPISLCFRLIFASFIIITYSLFPLCNMKCCIFVETFAVLYFTNNKSNPSSYLLIPFQLPHLGCDDDLSVQYRLLCSLKERRWILISQTLSTTPIQSVPAVHSKMVLF